MEWINNPEAWAALATLTALEIVLGIDNIVFISILTGRLPEEERAKARRIGLILAMVMRIGLLFVLSWIMSLKKTLFTVFQQDISGKDIILIVGGLFLLAKATHEIHHKLEGQDEVDGAGGKGRSKFAGVITQILLLDIVFSVDSVVTAVGMAGDFLMVMILAVVISVIVMVVFVNKICAFVERHPTVKMLALSFLLLIGMALVGDGLGMNFPKGYIYFAMAFSFAVEMLNLRVGSKAPPVKLRGPDLDDE